MLNRLVAANQLDFRQKTISQNTHIPGQKHEIFSCGGKFAKALTW